MSLPQNWSESKQQFSRALPLPLRLNIKHDTLRKETHQLGLEELADVATRQLSLSEYSLAKKPKPSFEAQQFRLPSFQESFSTVIAAADGLVTHIDDHHGAYPAFESRGTSPMSECSWRGSISSVPGLTPLSTAQTTPAVSPITPPAHYNISSQNALGIQILLTDEQSPRGRLGQRLALVHSRRTANRPSAYGLDQPQSRRRRRISRQPPRGGNKNRHFNQKYKNPDKLFNVYHREDLKWGWPAIQARRLELLTCLLGHDYDRAVEEARTVAGLNGMYYRENDLNMPVLTPDGSGLVFVERDGRWWECTRSQKCRDVDVNSKTARRDSVGTATKPRGMVERYPEEVLLYWEDHVRRFVPEDKRRDVYSRAVLYSEIRAEQRRQHGVPQWSLDNKDDRVFNLNPPKTADDALPKGRMPRRAKRS